MKKNRYFYVVASFMRKDKENTQTKVDFTVKKDDGTSLFPLMEAVKATIEAYADKAIPRTIQFDTYFEISKADYDAYNEFKGITNKLEYGKEDTDPISC